MPLTETKILAALNVDEHGVINVREDTVIYRDGAEIARVPHRRLIEPGADLSGEDIRISSLGQQVWTEPVLDAWEARRARAATESGPDEQAGRALLPWQFKAMLKIAGKEEAVATAIANMDDTTQRAVAEAKLVAALEFRRDDPLVEQLAGAIGLSVDDLDELWEQAVALR